MLKIWELFEYEGRKGYYVKGDLVYNHAVLQSTSHTINRPLEPETTYYWLVVDVKTNRPVNIRGLFWENYRDQRIKKFKQPSFVDIEGARVCVFFTPKLPNTGGTDSVIRQIQKHEDSFGHVAQIYERLLKVPQTYRKQNWILNSQILDEISLEEKGIVMVSIDGKQFIAADWFFALSEIIPPNRPRDLNTALGVEAFLDNYLLAERFIHERLAAQPWVRAYVVEGTIRAYREFIQKYPESKYCNLAIRRLKYLQKDGAR